MHSIQKELFRRAGAIRPNFRGGDTVKVYVPSVSKGKVIEKEVSGTCIRVTSQTFTIRVGMDADALELIYSFYTPNRVDLVSCGDVRRARLYYLRDLIGKQARIKKDFRRKEQKNANN